MESYHRKMKIISSAILLCISLLGFSQTPSTQSFHDTKGNTEVTPAGQLQYTLPIDLPPGVKNMAPEVSLIYTSGGQNGLAGYGWNISGVTSISRVGKNIEKDGIIKGVQLDYSDYYSFNGQRLILKSGEYGKDGAEYVTEKYSNMKIKSVGAISGQVWQGPEYWEVTFSDGTQVWYGATASGNSPARTPIDYNIVKSKDISGNYITYNYVSDGNVSVISNIQWGGNESQNTQHFNKIDFVFTARPMPETAYIKGVSFSQSKLLESVIVSTGGSQYKKYNVTYKKDTQETAYRYIDKITILNSKNEAANPVIFTYDKSKDYYFPKETRTTLKPSSESDVVGDFDGDGNLDLLRYHPVTSTKIPQVGLYMYKNFYKLTENCSDCGYSSTYLGNTITELKDAVAVNLKKDNLIRNRQGFAAIKKVVNPSTSKTDLEVSFYSITENNQLTLDYKKTILNAQYDFSTGTSQQGARTSVIGLKNLDLNGDGLSEVILHLNDRVCRRTDINDAGRLPHECNDDQRYYVIDTDESIQNNEWYYELPLYNKYDENVFVHYRMGDFNGDGLLDFLKIDQNKKPQLITFQKNTQGKYISSIAPFNPANNQVIQGYWEDALAGDFNGDGLSDLVVPGTNTSAIWYKYISTGIGFIEDTFVFERVERNRRVFNDPNEDIRIYNPRTFVAYDINNDGKTDLVQQESQKLFYRKPSIDSSWGAGYRAVYQGYLNVFSPYAGSNSSLDIFYRGQELNLSNANIDVVLGLNSWDLMGIPADLWTGGMIRTLTMGSIVPLSIPDGYGVGQEIASTKYYDISKEGRIIGISQGGVTTDITYKQLDKSINPGLYDKSTVVNYPYVEISNSTGINVVSQLTQSTTTPNKNLKQDFRYRGLTSNILGRGMIGFRKTARSSWYADGFENTKIWSGVEIDPVNEGVPVKEWSIRTNDETKIFPADVSENNSQLLSFKSTTYQIDKLLNGQVVTTVSDADKPKVVTAIVPKTSKGKDFLTGVTAESTVNYGGYYLPAQNISKINNGFAVTTSSYVYNNNASGTGSSYYIGLPASKTEIIQAYGDTKGSNEEYTYENSRLKTVKKWNDNNTGYLLETYTYDGFGNIIQKTVSNSADAQTVTTKSAYDTRGRFVIRKTDNLGLETLVTYNDWGQVLTQTDPLGNILTNTYDDWGKLLTSKTNLGGMATYTYDRDSNSNIAVTRSDADGDISKSFTNKLGQEYRTSAKAFGQGKFVSKETQYDVLGRKIKDSEPYFDGQSANQWNVIAYDDSVYPAKITSTAFNGKQTETSISGLITTVKETNGYARTTSKTADALGNIISTTDKGGTVQFSYNAAGEQIQAKYAENIVTTKYDVWGRKSEFNDPSNGVYKYEYTGLGRPKKTISPKGTKEYVYNNLGQLISQKELSTTDGGQATNKLISYTYNNKGALITKAGTSNGKPYSAVFTYDPYGRLLSSLENSNGIAYTQKEISYDDKGRITSYKKELQSSAALTKVAIENLYSNWNGELYQVKDKNSGKILWELKETNATGQVLKAKLGAAEVNNTFDTNGFLTGVNHSSAVKPGILQLSYSFDAVKNELKSRTTGGDFNITESFDYDDNNRLINWTNPVTGVKPAVNRNGYDVKGRIVDNDQVGKIKFENSAKIYQPTGMILNTAGAQNYNNNLIQNIVYNENNDPVEIIGEQSKIYFEYGLGSMRQKVTYGQNGRYSKFYNEDGSSEVVKDNTTGKEKHILYIGGTPYESDIVYLKNFDDAAGSYKFLHKGYLGSILAISDEAGNKLEQRHFDAWGNITHLKIGNGGVITSAKEIKDALLEQVLLGRGYTSHEHFAEAGIIHMNGRLYDPLLRRFLNADENIQDPTNTQNYNKYGYVMNNPMMYNDPDGEFWLWLAGAIVGGYLNGVSANNGQWNPGKWNWEKTWSAVVGGAIGGAAISGTLGSIVNNAGAIKSFLPGIVSGGLNSAFNGSNFLNGAIGGISYTSNIFGNTMTSTDMADIPYGGYKTNSEGYSFASYSDDSSGLSGYSLLTKSIFASFYPGASERDISDNFENMVLDMSVSNGISLVPAPVGTGLNRVPDGFTFTSGIDTKTTIPGGVKTRAQFMKPTIIEATITHKSNVNRKGGGQLYDYVDWLSKDDGNLFLFTTSNVMDIRNLIRYGDQRNVNVFHMVPMYKINSTNVSINFIQRKYVLSLFGDYTADGNTFLFNKNYYIPR